MEVSGFPSKQRNLLIFVDIMKFMSSYPNSRKRMYEVEIDIQNQNRIRASLEAGKSASGRAYYSLNPQTNSFPCNYPYQHPSSSILNFYNNPYLPPFAYPPSNYPLPVFQQAKKIEKKIKREVIDLESPPIVKEQAQSQERPDFSAVKSVQPEESKVKKMESSVKLVGANSFDKYSLRANNLQCIFKALLTRLVAGKPDVELAGRQFEKELREQNEFQAGNKLSETFFNALWNKFESFKKTKEEMIKHIIRRTYHNAKNRWASICKSEFEKLEQFHDRNLKLHKSMNNDFLRKEFSNKLFVTIFKEFIEQMDEQFERENEERITRFVNTLSSSWAEQSISIIKYEKKMPWLELFKAKLRKIAVDLLHFYEDSTLRAGNTSPSPSE